MPFLTRQKNILVMYFKNLEMKTVFDEFKTTKQIEWQITNQHEVNLKLKKKH